MRPGFHFVLSALCIGAVLASQFAVLPSRRYDAEGLMFIAVMVGVALLFAYTGNRARRNAAKHHLCLCRACGYDLRATPGRCPECGAAAAVSPP